MIFPSFFDSFFNQSTSSSKRQQCATISCAPLLALASTIFSAWRVSIAMGFSTITCRPAFSAAIA
jgi:hypothetical protein